MGEGVVAGAETVVAILLFFNSYISPLILSVHYSIGLLYLG
jgi:hypothetical protein